MGLEAVTPVVTRNTRLRWLGAALILLIFSDSVLGILASNPGGPLTVGIFLSHVVLGVGLVVVGAVALVLAFRLPSRPARAAASTTFAASLGAAVVASAALATGVPALALDRALALIALAGAALLTLWGSVPVEQGHTR
jgi:hypothetical protein